MYTAKELLLKLSRIDILTNLARLFFLPVIHLYSRNSVSSIERAKAYTENSSECTYMYVYGKKQLLKLYDALY